MASLVRIAFDEGLLRTSASVVWLVGTPLDPLTVLAPLVCQHFSKPLVPDLDGEAKELLVLMPAGLEVVGCVVAGGSDQLEALSKAAELAVSIRRMLGAGKGNPSGVLAGFVSDKVDIVYRLFRSDTSSVMAPVDVTRSAGSEEFWKIHRILRCQMVLIVPLYLPEPCSASQYAEQVARDVKEAIADLKSSQTFFLANNSQGRQKETVLIEPHKYVEDNFGDSDSQGGLLNGKVDIRIADLDSGQFLVINSGIRIPPPISLTAFKRHSPTDQMIEAPLLQYIPATGRQTCRLLPLHLDVLAVDRADALLSHAVAKLVLPALCDQLLAMQIIVNKNHQLDPVLLAYHFWPNGLLLPITVVHNLSYSETETVQMQGRKKLHERLGLPLNRPLLRVANALSFEMPWTGRSMGVKRLVDVHNVLTTGPVAGGHLSLVQGSYEYYHYMQDHMDDNGWGCAYRSLQTIVSWFKLQHYTALDVPSHEEIQKTLVEVGDKEPEFMGSRDWIGAIELSFVLDKYLGVSSKILTVNSGAELPSKCRELALHFQTQGTPVMIGGGVLAYTLLGVQYNELTGESAFLILDPHYTGGEDIKAVTSGGWCGWKKAISDRGEEFFLRNKFYNLLLPQRPNTV